MTQDRIHPSYEINESSDSCVKICKIMAENGFFPEKMAASEMIKSGKFSMFKNYIFKKEVT